jgi:hypothetical protein
VHVCACLCQQGVKCVDQAAIEWVAWHQKLGVCRYSLVCGLAGCWQRLLLALSGFSHGIDALVAPAVQPATHLSARPCLERQSGLQSNWQFLAPSQYSARHCLERLSGKQSNWLFLAPRVTG